MTQTPNKNLIAFYSDKIRYSNNSMQAICKVKTIISKLRRM